MEKIKDYITAPSTIISCIVAIFGFGVTRGVLGYRVSEMEERMDKFEQMGIEAQLKEMSVDIQRIKTSLNRIEQNQNK